MIYKLTFLKPAKKEWDNLSKEIQRQFKIKISKIRENPRIPKNKLCELKDCYKIKLRASGYRLAYTVYEDRLLIQIIAVGKRDKSEVYNFAHHRMN